MCSRSRHSSSVTSHSSYKNCIRVIRVLRHGDECTGHRKKNARTLIATHYSFALQQLPGSAVIRTRIMPTIFLRCRDARATHRTIHHMHLAKIAYQHFLPILTQQGWVDWSASVAVPRNSGSGIEFAFRNRCGPRCSHNEWEVRL